ncbi:hypothetical protein [Streptomyces sp. NBC_01235]|uniref:hypothetical protein n=1 Tax=Streptomyces sp. NBC_01235 TaxID=2903788 RepID=UPI002E12D69B|nr:hypothetical protein OG289_09090 [Streptomyces sp. NBC_01235]
MSANADVSRLIGSFSGIGTLGILVLMALASLAIIVWFARDGGFAGERERLEGRVAPGIAFLALKAVVVYAISHFELLVGGYPGQYLWLLLIPAANLVAGCIVAARFRQSKPERYARLGRAESVC